VSSKFLLISSFNNNNKKGGGKGKGGKGRAGRQGERRGREGGKGRGEFYPAHLCPTSASTLHPSRKKLAPPMFLQVLPNRGFVESLSIA